MKVALDTSVLLCALDNDFSTLLSRLDGGITVAAPTAIAAA